MAFPASERVVYSKNPLVQVTCGLRFPPILAIVSKEPADFQERVRTVYPLYETGVVFPPVFSQQAAPLLAQLPISSGLPTVHRFLNEDRTAEINLARDFISIATRKYRRWEEFRERIVLAMNALEEIYRPPFYAHVELRYQDVIDRNALGLSQIPWSQLIQSAVIGLLADPSVGTLVVSAQSQTLVKLENDQFLNLIQTLGHQAQILGNQLTLDNQPESQVYAIDADFYTANRRTSEQVPADLARFNSEAGYFFRWAITPKLRDALQPVSLK